MSLKLNIGAGSTVIEGFTPIDRKFGSEAYPLPYPDNSVDEIRASHILEHFTFGEARDALAEWHRVLRPGGKIRVAVPDVDKIAASKDPKRFFWLFGGQTDANDVHKSGYDAPRLESYLNHVGFTRIQPWVSPNTDTAAHECSLNREAFKADATAGQEIIETEQEVKIGAYMTLPRYEAVAARTVIESSLKQLGIPLSTSQGVFWGQCMQRMFTEAVKKDLDWILSLDSDSLFSPEQLSKLLDVFASTPDADAMAALQCRRGSGFPLLTTGNHAPGDTLHVDPSIPIKVTTAHFGLTLIRVEALKEVTKPWFYGKPDEDGDWGDKRLDDDIWFWHKWRNAGKTIYVAPSVSIGHLEEMVAYFDSDLKPSHQYVPQWREQNLGQQIKSN